MISEGLQVNDLDGVLIPVISIDEYHGKIDDKSIVVSFFLTDPDAAIDLSSFIESGPYDILDTDVSKSINEDGYYQVFIEMERTDHFYYDLKDILDSLDSLSGNLKWTFMAPRSKGDAVPFTEDEIKHKLFYKTIEKPNKDGTSEKSESMEEAVMEFLSHSNASDVRLYESEIVIQNNNLVTENKFVTFSDEGLLNHILGLSVKKNTQNPIIAENVKKLSAILGSDWLVETAGQFILVSSSYSPNKILLLK